MLKTATLFRKFINQYFIQSQIWVSLCFTSLGAYYQYAYFLNFNVLVLCILGLSCWVGYVFISDFDNEKYQFLSRKSKYIFLIGCAVLLILYTQINGKQALMGLGISMVAALYNWRFKGKTLRDFPYFKLFYIALIWSLFLVFFNLNESPVFLFLSCFIFVLGITLPFDIRDNETDSIKTIAGNLGLLKTKIASLFCLVLSYVLFQFVNPDNFWIHWVHGFALLIACGIIAQIPPKNNYFYISFWVEGISALFLWAVLLFNSIF